MILFVLVAGMGPSSFYEGHSTEQEVENESPDELYFPSQESSQHDNELATKDLGPATVSGKYSYHAVSDEDGPKETEEMTPRLLQKDFLAWKVQNCNATSNKSQLFGLTFVLIYALHLLLRHYKDD